MTRLLACAAALALLGCAASKAKAPVAALETPADEIARWEEASSRGVRAAEGQRRLFELYTLPTPDYDRSAAALASWLSLDPQAAEDREVRRWQLVLGALKDAKGSARKEHEENAALRGDVRELKKNLADARRENQELRETLEKLKETLEKLKELDLQLDRSRRAK